MGDNLVPVPLMGHKAIQITAGDSRTCALLDNGAIECWGYNGVGQLGIGSKKPLGTVPGFTLEAVDLQF
jgi:alpha-tubulin suppressor-like RCC1 family protein